MSDVKPGCAAYKHTTQSVHETVSLNMSEDFNREDDLQFFAQPYVFELEYAASAAPHSCVVVLAGAHVEV